MILVNTNVSSEIPLSTTRESKEDHFLASLPIAAAIPIAIAVPI